jgi:hypothetical protein
MRPHSRRIQGALWAVLLGVSVAMLSGPTRAEDTTQFETARARFEEGVRYYENREYAKARTAFKQAYAVRAHPSILLNLAQSELRSDHEVDAANHFARYLREVDAGAPARKQAENGLVQAKKKVAEITVKAAEGAQIIVDGQEHGVSPLAGPVYVSPGTHSFQAKLGEGTAIVSLEAAAGESQEVSLGLRGPQGAQPSEEDEAPPRERSAPDRAGSSAPSRPGFFSWVTSRPAGMVLGGVTVLGVAGGVTFLIQAKSADDSALQTDNNLQSSFRETGYTGSPCSAQDNPDYAHYYPTCLDLVDLLDRRNRFNSLAIGSFVVAGVAAGATVAIYFLTAKPTPPARQVREYPTQWLALRVAPVVLPKLQGVTVSGQF